jgi:hypothetical protein
MAVAMGFADVLDLFDTTDRLVDTLETGAPRTDRCQTANPEQDAHIMPTGPIWKGWIHRLGSLGMGEATAKKTPFVVLVNAGESSKKAVRRFGERLQALERSEVVRSPHSAGCGMVAELRLDGLRRRRIKRDNGIQ